MSDKSRIEWTEATWNPVTGCSKVSQGCKHCYAEREWPRMSAPRPQPNVYTGRAFTDVQCHPERLAQPLLWKRPRRIFVNSMSDLFHENVSDDFIADVFNVMAQAKHHVFQVLTKRPERMRDFMCGTSGMGCGGLFMPNVWLGVSVEDQATANERIPFLLDIDTHVRWISAEPLLGPIDLTQIVGASGETWNALDRAEGFDAGIEGGADGIINWVVVGGESGPRARPMHPEWARSLRDQCAAAGVPFFFKQWGEFKPAPVFDAPMMQGGRAFSDGAGTCAAVIRSKGGNFKPGVTRPMKPGDRNGYGIMLDADTIALDVGKKAAGRLLDGIEHNGMPEVSA